MPAAPVLSAIASLGGTVVLVVLVAVVVAVLAVTIVALCRAEAHDVPHVFASFAGAFGIRNLGRSDSDSEPDDEAAEANELEDR